MKTVNEVQGYKFSSGSSSKKWVRGRVMFSEGRKWISQNEWVPIITKTNLDSGEVTEANEREKQKFIIE
jgi:hypothetical protein